MEEFDRDSPPSSESLENELQELCDKFPPFSRQSWVIDDEWFKTQLRKGKVRTIDGIEPKHLIGKIAAVYNREFVAAGDDEAAIRIELAKKYRVHPGRFVLRRLNQGAIRSKFAVIGSAMTLAIILVFICSLFVAAISALGTKSNATFSRIGSGIQ